MRYVDGPNGLRRTVLETWGEIAVHLNVEIRTAQRRESHGLPVHRYDGEQAVFAYADEIDAWRTARQRSRQTEPPATKPDTVLMPLSGTSPPIPEPIARSAVMSSSEASWLTPSVLLVAVIAAAGAGLAFLQMPKGSVEPSVLAVQGSRLVAFGPTGSSLWSFEFISPPVPIDTAFREQTKWWERMDADADGIDELLVIVEQAPNAGGTVETLFCFSLDGQLRYSYQPSESMLFEAGQFNGPWRFWDLESVPETGGLWVALENKGEWQAMVVKVSADGVASRHYSQPGRFNVVKRVVLDGRPSVLVGGINNEFGSASLAIVDPTAPPSAAPGRGNGPYRCLDCPSANPVKFYLFSPSPLNGAEGLPYNRVNHIESTPASIEVVVLEAQGANTAAAMHYHLTKELEVESAIASDTYWRWKPAADPGWYGETGSPVNIDVRQHQGGGWSSASLPIASMATRAAESRTSAFPSQRH